MHHWPELMKKEPGGYFFGLDSALISRTVPSTGFAYATAMATLWDSSLEVRQVLNQRDVEDENSPGRTVKRRNAKDNAFWFGGFWEEYLEQRGRVRAIAPKLDIDPTHLREKFNQLGLPSLHDVATASRWRAFLSFEAGVPLSQACAAEGVSEVEVLKLIRLSCARVANAAKQIQKSYAAELTQAPLRRAKPAKLKTQKSDPPVERSSCEAEPTERLLEQAS